MSSTEPLRYHAVARALHWAIAVLIILQFVGGWLMVRLSLPSELTFTSYQLHKSFGFVVLGLSVYRLYWRVRHPVPALPKDMPAWERWGAKVSHLGFYGLMIGIPLLGWAIVSTDPIQIPTKLFFFVPVPHLPLPVTETAADWAKDLHRWFALAAIGLLVLHVGAALKHHFADGDDVLIRMLPVKGDADMSRAAYATAGSAIAALALIGLMLLLTLGSNTHNHDDHAHTESVEEGGMASAADDGEPALFAWVVDREASYVEATGTAYGAAQSVRFEGLSAGIALDPANPAEVGRIQAEVRIASLDAAQTTREQLLGQSWFDADTFPVATFLSEAIRPGEADGAYVAEGTITIKDVTVPLSVPFTLEISDGRGVAEAQFTLDRTVFGLAPNDRSIEPSAAVTVHIEADRADAASE